LLICFGPEESLPTKIYTLHLGVIFHAFHNSATRKRKRTHIFSSSRMPKNAHTAVNNSKCTEKASPATSTSGCCTVQWALCTVAVTVALTAMRRTFPNVITSDCGRGRSRLVGCQEPAFEKRDIFSCRLLTVGQDGQAFALLTQQVRLTKLVKLTWAHKLALYGGYIKRASFKLLLI